MKAHLVQKLSWFSQLSISQERSKELEEINQKLMKQRPALHTVCERVGSEKQNHIIGTPSAVVSAVAALR